MNNSDPIGIFDSGIGGLNIARSIKKKLPNESLIYFGDTQHLPYGDKSSESIVFFSNQIIEFLKSKNCKAIVVACNSASSHLTNINNDRIYNVIDPVIEYVRRFKKIKIGIIGTRATISSKVYLNKIQNLNRNLSVEQMSTPLLVPMIEEGFINEVISKKIIRNYLMRRPFKAIDKLILACTHYPLIQEQIMEVCPKIEIINTVEIITKYVKDKLESLNLLSNSSFPKYDFYASNYTDSFEKTASLFFKEKIKLKEIKLWP